MAYHISYEKVKSYEMPEDNFKTVSPWKKQVLNSYGKLRAYKKTPDATYRIQPSSMKGGHQRILEDALSYRMNMKKRKNNGALVFKDIIGEYRVFIDDMAVIEKRMKVLGEILDIFNSDIKLTTQDPNPSGRHLGEEQVIELMEISLESAIRQALLVVTYQQKGKIKIGAVMGYITKNYPQFKEEMPKISKIVKKDIVEVRNLFNTEGLENLQKLIEKEFPDISLIKESKEKDIKLDGKIVYYFAGGNYSPENIYYELPNGDEKEIDFNQLIRKFKHDKSAQQKLNLLKPGGPDWPLSAAGTYYLVISNDPFLVATKSTGRVWANQSCENYNGAYSRGPFSDIRYGNCVVYIFESETINEGWPILFDNKKLKGRTLLRWGLKDNKEGQFGVGVERRVYPSNKKWGIPMATAIGMILQEKELLDYKTCRNPYKYGGWSDTMGNSSVKITYAGLRMEGKTIDLQKLVFAPELNLAGSPTISYSDLHRLSRASMDIRIKRELSQNPSIWQFPEVVGRLIRLKDEIIIRQLTYQSIANGGALDSIAKILPSLDKDSWIRNTAILEGIVKHHNTLPETHQWLVENHPGWGDNTSFLEWAYLDQPICYAPPQILDLVLSSFEREVKEHFVISGKKLYIDPVDGKEYKTQRGLENWMEKMNHQGAMIIGGQRVGLSLKALNKMVENIIFAPHMSKKQFLSLLNIIMDNFSDYGGSQVDKVDLQKLQQIIGLSVLVPLTHKSDWGFTNKGLSGSFNAGEAYGISLSRLNTLSKEWQSMFRINRQFKESVLSAALFSPWIQGGPKDSDGCPLLENLRKANLHRVLWENRLKLKNISSLSYCMQPRSQRDFSSPSPKEIVSDEVIMWAYEETDDENIGDFRYTFLPYDEENRMIRYSIPQPIITPLLNEKERISQIGYGIVALWLTDSRWHFDVFEELVMGEALGNLWADGELLDLPNPRKNPREYMEANRNLKLDILQTAAIGEVWGESGKELKTGLVYNNRLPDKLQYNLLDDKSNLSWERISNKYQGNYSEYLSFVEEGLASNSNAASNLLSRLQNKEYLQKYIASNINTPLSLLTGHKGGGRQASLYYNYPVEVLTNSALSNRVFMSLWDVTFSFLTMPVDEDIERLFNLFTEQRTHLLESQGKNTREQIQNLLSNHSNWLRYWRGGSIKKGIFSPYEKQNLFKGKGGISDYPLPIVGEPFIFFKFEEQDYTLNKLYYIEKLEGLERERYNIKGSIWEYDTDENIFKNSPINEVININEFYDYILEDERGEDYILYSIKLENHKKESSADRKVVEDFIMNVNEEEETDYSTELIEEIEREAEKWSFGNLFNFKDNDPPKQGVIVPQWRYKWNKKMLDSILLSYIKRQNPQYLINSWAENPYRVDSSEIKTKDSAILDAEALFTIIDENKLWTKKLVNANIHFLFADGGNIFGNLSNIPLTKKLLKVSLLHTKKELSKYGLTVEMMPLIHQKILTYSSLPPSYLYALYNISAHEVVIRMIKDLRMKMPSEFNQYLLDNSPEHPEGD